MTRYEELQSEHQRLLNAVSGDNPAAHLDEVQAYIERVKNESQEVTNPRDRNQLRAILRYWGSWVFEQKGVFPNTTLLPQQEAAPQGLFGWLPTVSVPWLLVGGLLLFALALATAWVLGQRPATQPILTGKQATQTALAEMALLTSFPAAPEATEAPTSRPPATSTVAGLPTSLPASKPTRTPVGTKLPITGGGPTFVSAEISARPASNCAARNIILASQGSQAPAGLKVPPAKVEVSQAGSDQVVFSGRMPLDQPSRLEVILPEPDSSQTYLVKLDHPVTFENVILAFPTGCSQNLVTITYHLDDLYALYQDFTQTAKGGISAPVGLDWRLLNWGLAGDSGYWTATVQFTGLGADPDAAYLDLAAQPPNILPDQKIVVTVKNCDPAELFVGLTSRGSTVAKDVVLSLFQPGCPLNQ